MQDFDKLNANEKLSQLMDGEWQSLHPAESVADICGDQALRAKWTRYHLIRDCINNEPVSTDNALVSRICAAIDDEPAYSNVSAFSAGESSAQEQAAVQSSFNSTSEPAGTSSQHGTKGNVEQITHGSTAQATAVVQEPSQSSWVNTGLAGFALAASVALVTVVGLDVFQQQNSASDVPTVASIETVVPVTTSVAQNLSVEQQVTGANTQASEQALHFPDVELVSNTGTFWVSPESSQRVADEGRLNMMLSEHIENSPTATREGLLPYSRLVGYEQPNP